MSRPGSAEPGEAAVAGWCCGARFTVLMCPRTVRV